MKLKNILILSLGIVAVTSTFLSCDKEFPQVAPVQVGLSDVATVQVFSATVKATRNYVYVDGTPVSGAALAYGRCLHGLSLDA